jgi:hypothetical protein
MIEQSEHQKTIDLLISAGFETGWVLSGGVLVVWEHEQDPPKPLKRPK